MSNESSASTLREYLQSQEPPQQFQDPSAPPPPTPANDQTINRIDNNVGALMTLLEPKPTGQSQSAVILDRLDLLTRAVTAMTAEIAGIRAEQVTIKAALENLDRRAQHTLAAANATSRAVDALDEKIAPLIAPNGLLWMGEAIIAGIKRILERLPGR